MKLIIGGYAQGKLNYVLQQIGQETYRIWDGELPRNTDETRGIVVINHLHHWIRLRIANGACPEREIKEVWENYPDCVIISDEIGNGIVSLKVEEREYRERTGRILVELAARAEEVERVICGIGQKIK